MKEERFNKICDLVEHKARYAHKSPSQIVEEIAQGFGVTARGLQDYFALMSGTPLKTYIRERKMMAVYESILDSEEYDAKVCVELSGLADQPTFNKRFKKTFGLTPLEAFQKKDRSLLKIKITWKNTQQTQNVSTNSDMIFGLTRAKYSEIKELVLLEEQLGFEESQSKIAYYLYEFCDMSLKEAFEFVDAFYREEKEQENFSREINSVFSFLSSSISDGNEKHKISREKILDQRIKNDAEDSEFRYVYFHGDIDSIIAIYDVIDKLHEAGEEDVAQVDIDVINICAHEDIDAKHCLNAVAYFRANATEKHGEEAFCEYIEYILRDVPIETAFKNIYQLDGWDDYSDCTAFDMEQEFEYDKQEMEILDTFTDFSARTDDREETRYDYFHEGQ